MTFHGIVRIVLSILLISSAYAGQLEKLYDPPVTVNEWVVADGRPLYIAGDARYVNVLGDALGPRYLEGSELSMKLSPGANYRLISLLQPMDQIKDGMRYTDHYVYDHEDQLAYTITRGSGADLKAAVAAISDEGTLALVDPINATVAFYRGGSLLAETQLYRTEGDHSLERKAFIKWVGSYLHILIERPGRGGAGPQNAIKIKIDTEGRNQTTTLLPFTYLLDHVFEEDRHVVSGYSYQASSGEFAPQIMELDASGRTLWTNENFGHELALSADGSYLAARKSHAAVIVFDLEKGRVEEVEFRKEGKVALGLAVTNRGNISLIRVDPDFFVKKSSHHAEVFFPRSGSSTSVQLNPNLPAMFKIHSDGHRFLLGSQYEWLEIRE